MTFPAEHTVGFNLSQKDISRRRGEEGWGKSFKRGTFTVLSHRWTSWLGWGSRYL